MLAAVAPILPVRDLAAAIRQYRALGFDVTTYDGGGYAYARRDAVQLHLSVVGDLNPHLNNSAVYLYVADARVLAQEWRRSPGKHVSVSDTPYGLREGCHVDPDGNLLRFGSPL